MWVDPGRRRLGPRPRRRKPALDLPAARHVHTAVRVASSAHRSKRSGGGHRSPQCRRPSQHPLHTTTTAAAGEARRRTSGMAHDMPTSWWTRCAAGASYCSCSQSSGLSLAGLDVARARAADGQASSVDLSSSVSGSRRASGLCLASPRTRSPAVVKHRVHAASPWSSASHRQMRLLKDRRLPTSQQANDTEKGDWPSERAQMAGFASSFLTSPLQRPQRNAPSGSVHVSMATSRYGGTPASNAAAPSWPSINGYFENRSAGMASPVYVTLVSLEMKHADRES